jgi:uroporphyrinogen-III synthase
VLKKVLITKDITEVTPFINSFLEKGYELLAESFIEFQENIIKDKITSEVVFFSSRRGFDYFLKQNLHQRNFEVACVGSETKKHIENQGYKVCFSGTNSGDVAFVSKELNTWLQGRSISYFLSNLSKRTIDTHIASSEKQEFIIYNTDFIEKKIALNFDYLVFTSPSNVEAFLKQNKVPKEVKIISWGKTTDFALAKHALIPFLTLSNSSIESLLEALLR